jgi:hypothetical protein
MTLIKNDSVNPNVPALEKKETKSATMQAAPVPA